MPRWGRRREAGGSSSRCCQDCEDEVAAAVDVWHCGRELGPERGIPSLKAVLL